MTRRLAKVRLLTMVMAVIGLYIVNEDQLAAAPLIQDCGGPLGICAPDSDCSESCADEVLGVTTCGDYGGFNGETCDIDSCWHSCQDWVSGAECYNGGQATTCGSFGTYRQCGDGYCSRSPIQWEACGGAEYCQADCGSCPEGPQGPPECDKTKPDDPVCGGLFCNGAGSCCEGNIYTSCEYCQENESCTGVPTESQTRYFCVKRGGGCSGL